MGLWRGFLIELELTSLLLAGGGVNGEAGVVGVKGVREEGGLVIIEDRPVEESGDLGEVGFDVTDSTLVPLLTSLLVSTDKSAVVACRRNEADRVRGGIRRRMSDAPRPCMVAAVESNF